MQTLDVILVADRTQSVERLREGLEAGGCRVETLPRGASIPPVLAARRDPLVLLCIESGGVGALAWCRDLRAASPASRICVLFDRADETQQIVVLEMGADAAQVGPISPRRLAAQIHALARSRSRPAGRYVVGPLEIREDARDARLAGRPLDLTTLEYDLLLLLARHAGRVLSRDVIKRGLRGLPHDDRDRSIDLNMVRLRRKLGDDPRHPRFIKTVRGLGYMLIATES